MVNEGQIIFGQHPNIVRPAGKFLLTSAVSGHIKGFLNKISGAIIDATIPY